MKRWKRVWAQMIISPSRFHNVCFGQNKGGFAPFGSEASSGSKEDMISHGDLLLDSDRHLCSWKGVEVKLTVTEFLCCRRSPAPRPCEKPRSADGCAYGDSVFLEDRTIDSHIKRIGKFRAHDKSFDRIETLYGIGYKYKGDA